MGQRIKINDRCIKCANCHFSRDYELYLYCAIDKKYTGENCDACPRFVAEDYRKLIWTDEKPGKAFYRRLYEINGH